MLRQAGLLVGVFVITLAVLAGAFFGFQQVTAGPEATPSAAPSTSAPSPSPRPTVAPSATHAAAPTAAPSEVPSLAASPSRAPALTPAPTEPSSSGPVPAPSTAAPVPAPSIGATGKVVIIVLGSQYATADVPGNGKITPGNGGAITMSTDRTTSAGMQLDYELPADRIPPGFTIRSLDTRVCGMATGDFWESYGPPGSEPDESEFTPPQPDGCWHYVGAPGDDTVVKVAIRLNSTMTITRIEYTATVSH